MSAHSFLAALRLQVPIVKAQKLLTFLAIAYQRGKRAAVFAQKYND